MGIDQARQDDVAVEVDLLLFRVGLDQLSGFPDRPDSVIGHQDRPVLDDDTIGIHGEDRGVGEDQGVHPANASTTGLISGMSGYKIGHVTPASMYPATVSRHCDDVPTAISFRTNPSGMRWAALR